MYDIRDLKRDATDSDWGMLLLYGFYHIQLTLTLVNHRLINTFLIPNIIYLIMLVIFFYKRKKEKKKSIISFTFCSLIRTFAPRL